MQKIGQQGIRRAGSEHGSFNYALGVTVGALGLVAMGTAAMAWPVVKSAIVTTPASTMITAPETDLAKVSAFVGETQDQLSAAKVTAPVVTTTPTALAEVELTMPAFTAVEDTAIRPEPRAVPRDPVMAVTPSLPLSYTTAQSATASAQQPSEPQSGKRLLDRWSAGEFR
ncbi:hypothetical protein M3N55_10660 [Roseibaca sp. V10]|uniref:Uncharacterized protein n=1 Tax=Roseinatronobacter domitianus TaxID=2940293 RepID=A0ABT0M4H2_9RHOB|nr:hypothetical protein [Roseibaca domitiana]MCL1629194.1 hypothetical protein [Roseibaca domitiana]